MSQFALKLLAMLSMLLDHTAKVVLSRGVLVPMLGIEGNQALYTFMTVIGRMAFPIFAWFAAEGCRKTSSLARYLARLGLFAVLSEVPFQLCFYGSVELGCHNVIFTLLLGAAGVFCGAWLQECRVPVPLAQLLPAAAAIACGWFLYTDYNAWGVGLVILLFYLPTEKGRLLGLAAWVTVFQLLWHGWDGSALVWLSPSGSIQLLNWLSGLLAVALLATYQGERGSGGKWLFYCFYPLHLLCLYGIAQCLPA